jgi:type II secretory pathway component GspD/PulD (secretin)
MGNTYYYVSSEGSTSSGSQTITTASIDLGVTLSLTGRVSDDGYITLYLHPEVSDVLYWKDVTGGGQLPQTTSRFADTIIRVKDGETIAIGGLLQENMSETAYKTPFLGSLPLVGGLFRYSDKKLTKTDIVFVIKTSLINDKS